MRIRVFRTEIWAEAGEERDGRRRGEMSFDDFSSTSSGVGLSAGYEGETGIRGGEGETPDLDLERRRENMVVGGLGEGSRWEAD